MENLPRSGLAAPGEVCFSFLERGGEFESSRLLKTAKTAVFASLVRYFYFTPPNSSILSQLFLFSSKPCSLCTKIPHQSAGFLLASRLSTKLGPSGETQTRGLMVPNHARYQLRYTRILRGWLLISSIRSLPDLLIIRNFSGNVNLYFSRPPFHSFFPVSMGHLNLSRPPADIIFIQKFILEMGEEASEWAN